MKQEEIANVLEHSPAIRLLRSRNCDFILSFFYQVFKLENIFFISEKTIIYKLEAYLNHISFFQEKDPVEDKEERAKQYIKNWTDYNYLNNYQDENGDVIYELTSYTEKVLNWLLDLEKREFIGTESRFKDIVNRLRELMIFSDEDREKRLNELKKQKENIDNEIRAIEETGEFEIFDDYQIKSRLIELTRSARELLSDFKEVQDNFNRITRELYQQHANPDYSKENILTLTFDSLDALKETDQGKSFYAFYEFLLSRSYQDEWESMITKLFLALSKKEIQYEDIFLKKMKTYLYKNGQKVYSANDRLAQKLSKIISEKEIKERIQIKKTIGRIKELYMEITAAAAKTDLGLTLNFPHKINLFMDKKLSLKNTEIPDIYNRPENTLQLDELMKLDGLFLQEVIDKKQLINNIQSLLKERSQVTLLEVVDAYPLQYGLSEIMAYLSLHQERKLRFLVDNETKDQIEFNIAKNKSLIMPRIIFSK